jgi:guanylate kinase
MTAILGDCREGLVFVVSAPAGTGKTTLAHMLVEEFSSVIASVSYTTRIPRLNEQEGIDYHFVNKTVFQEKIATEDFLEYVKLYDDYYGTSRAWLEQQKKSGKHVVLVIDTQGAMQLMRTFPAIFIFIRPPSLEVLRKRLIHRNTESPEKIKERLQWAEHELETAHLYDYQLVNDDLAVAYQALRSVVIAETYRTRRTN